MTKLYFFLNVNELLDLLKCKHVWGKCLRQCSNFNKHWTQNKLKKMGLNYGAQMHLAYLSVTNFRHFCLSLLERKKMVSNLCQYGTFLFTNRVYFIRDLFAFDKTLGNFLKFLVTIVSFNRSSKGASPSRSKSNAPHPSKRRGKFRATL